MECTYCTKPATGENVRAYTTPLGFSRSEHAHPNRITSMANANGYPTIVIWSDPACEVHANA